MAPAPELIDPMVVMDAREVFALLDELETYVPLRADTLEARFGVTFEVTRDWRQRELLVAKTSALEIELRPSGDAGPGDLSIMLPGVHVTWPVLAEKYPGGRSLPPPPPGYGPAEALYAYVVDRPFGQLWFTFYTGDRLVRVALEPGRSGSPGV
jgi:hypothetical protein